MFSVSLSRSCRAYGTDQHDPIRHLKTVQQGETCSADLECSDLCAMSMPYLQITTSSAELDLCWVCLSTLNIT